MVNYKLFGKLFEVFFDNWKNRISFVIAII